MLDAEDLGFSADDEHCQELAEAIGSAPPWSLASLTAIFDQRYPGWDDAPTLSLSSPLSRLRGLSEVFACNSNNSQTEGDALRELGHEVKHAQIRLLCPRPDSVGILQDECMFMLFVLSQVSDRLLVERETRRSERQVAEVELSRTREDLRKQRTEALAEAKDQTKVQLDELIQDAEAHRQRAARMEKELEQLQCQDRYVSEMENKIEEMKHEAARSSQVHAQLLEELCEVKAQRAALVVAHEESEGALDDMKRRIDAMTKAPETERNAPPTSVPTEPRTPISLPAASKLTDKSRTQAFTSGASIALSLQTSHSFEERCRPAFLAWRCARLQALHDKAGSALLQVSDAGYEHGDRTCCCSAPLSRCCQRKWLDATLKLLFEERSVHALVMEDGSTSMTWRRLYIFSFGIVAAFLLWMFLLHSESGLVDGPWYHC